jgi:hypothetical protein
LLAAGFALLLQPAARGQDSPLPRKPNTSVLSTYRNDTPRGGIPEDKLPEARKAFEAFAKYYADVIAHPLVWKGPGDLKVDPARAPPPSIDGPDGILREIDRFLLEPVPGGAKSGNFEPASYIREMGAALDAALKNLIETHPERIVRVNAARVLAHVARTGAPAHFRTVTALLSDPKTPPEVKYYVFRAAAGVLGAIDPTDQTMRKHAADPKTVGALVKVIEDSIANPAMLLPGYKPELATEDQLKVIGLVRRQAVRALAQVKFVTIPGPDGKAPLYPSYTLVRVAMSDPRLVPAPGPAECAEAVVGLCNMAAWQWKGDTRVPLKNYNADVAVEAIAQGLVTFAEPRAGNRNDRTLPWRAYALRIAEAMTKAKPLYDPDAAPPYQPTKFAAQLVPDSFERLYRFALPNILAPLDRVDNKDNPVADPDVPRLRQFLAGMQQNPKRKTVLFEGVPETTINFPAPKK